MAERFDSLSDELIDFIHAQRMFFVGTAAADGRVNVSPKGMDSLRVTGANEILWLNLTGSGNETAAHLQEVNRMTLMWCAFEGPPRILRAYGTADTIHPRHPDWAEASSVLPASAGTRQYYRLHIDLVQTSCGYAVPMYDYVEDRKALTMWADKRGAQGVQAYWKEKNQSSLDGLPTGILEDV